MVRYILFTVLFLVTTIINAQTDTLSQSGGDSLIDNTPAFSASLDLLEGEAETQDVSGLLQSSRDIYTSVAGFNFGAARYKVRGYDAENFTAFMGGIKLNEPESGRAIWSFWGGLNDITRYQETKAGIDASPYSFASIGGYSNISIRASEFRKGSRFSYAYTNRAYNHRVMLTHSTGMLKNGWAFTVSASRRYSKEGYVEGTFYDAASYFLSAEKKLNEQHSIGIVGFGSPTIQGRQGIATQEVYDLTGNNYYNPNWGYQNGEKRNARIRNNHKPMVLLNHYFTINEKSKLTSTVAYSFGKTGSTRLNWAEAKDPRPDYYRYLPSYFSEPGQELSFQQYTNNWQNGIGTQLNWDDMFFANSKNLYTVVDANGTEGNYVTGNRAKYIVEEERLDVSHIILNSVFSHKKNEHLNLTAGLNVSMYKSMNYKIVDDLLGADFWLDVDKFAETDFFENIEIVEQNDVDNPNRVVYEGDRFGYDFDININTYNVFAQAEVKSSKIDWFATLDLSQTMLWRTGNMKNGKFLEDSYGDSDKKNFFNYGIKAGLIYKITGRHLIRANTVYLTRAPFARNAFISPRTRNQIVDGLKSETIYSGDLSYLVRYPNVKLRVTGYYTEIKDRTWVRSFYHDELRSFVNYIMTGVNQLYTGMELGAEVKITPTISTTAVFGIGDFLYNSRPEATIVQDNSTELLAENKTIYIKNYHIGGTPQTIASLGLRYNSPKYWFAGISGNYFTDNYLAPNPDRRTEEAVSKYVEDDPQVDQILDQEKLDDGLTFDLFAGKSWRVKKKYFIRLNLSVSNILDEKDLKTGGFEQLRYDSNNIDRFPPKYGYMYGRSYFAMVSLLF